MPLVIAVLIIMVLCINAKEFTKNQARQSSWEEKSRRKTNARLERQTLDKYMKYGYSFDAAFKKTYEDMVAAGYDPCIPRDAYDNQPGVETSACRDMLKYESLLVRQRREEAERVWCEMHNKRRSDITLEDYPEIEAMTYRNFPKTRMQYLLDLQRSTMVAKAMPVGSFIIYPRLGTCEIIAHNWSKNHTSGTYTLRVLKTGQIIDYILIGDPKIQRQG